MLLCVFNKLKINETMCLFIVGWGTPPFMPFYIRFVQIKRILHICLRKVKWRLNKSERFISDVFSAS